jgi:hypothetical protein
MAAVALAPIAIKSITGIFSKIFGGMALRAKQAQNENQALQQVVQGFDQAILQLQQQYNSGQLTQQQALAEIYSADQWVWQSITPAIQPNRNGCESGQNCPPQVTPGYIKCGPAQGGSITIGASCCVGCGPIKTAIENIIAVIEAGGGVAVIPAIGGDKYGLQTRQKYSLTFKAPAFSSITQEVSATVSSLTGMGLYETNGVVQSGYSSLGGGVGGSNILFFGFLGIILLLVVLLVSRR